MSEDAQVTTTNQTEGAGPEPSAPESAPDSSVDHAAENADLRAMLKHYAGADINIDDLMSNNFNRAGRSFHPNRSLNPNKRLRPRNQNQHLGECLRPVVKQINKRILVYLFYHWT